MVKATQLCFYFVFHWIFKFIFRAKIVGIENIPQENFIIAANHTSKIDPFLLCLLPFSVIKKITPVYFLTSRYYYYKWFLYPILKSLGSYPTMNYAWTLDELLASSLSKLRKGKTIMIFPEGAIVNKNTKIKAHPGIGYLGAKTGKQILPLRIYWSKNYLGIRKLTLLFGQPLVIQPKKNNLEFFKQETQKIVSLIYSLQPPLDSFVNIKQKHQQTKH